MHVESRMGDLQIASPIQLILLLAICGDREGEFHRQFYKYRVRGEWFHLVSEIEEFIQQQLNPAQRVQDLYDQTELEKTWSEKLAAWLENSDPFGLRLLTLTTQRKLFGYISAKQQGRLEIILRSFGFVPGSPDLGRNCWMYQYKIPGLPLEKVSIKNV